MPRARTIGVGVCVYYIMCVCACARVCMCVCVYISGRGGTPAATPCAGGGQQVRGTGHARPIASSVGSGAAGRHGVCVFLLAHLSLSSCAFDHMCLSVYVSNCLHRCVRENMRVYVRVCALRDRLVPWRGVGWSSRRVRTHNQRHHH
jgi:hypothetical protein